MKSLGFIFYKKVLDIWFKTVYKEIIEWKEVGVSPTQSWKTCRSMQIGCISFNKKRNQKRNKKVLDIGFKKWYKEYIKTVVEK